MVLVWFRWDLLARRDTLPDLAPLLTHLRLAIAFLELDLLQSILAPFGHQDQAAGPQRAFRLEIGFAILCHIIVPAFENAILVRTVINLGLDVLKMQVTACLLLLVILGGEDILGEFTLDASSNFFFFGSVELTLALLLRIGLGFGVGLR